MSNLMITGVIDGGLSGGLPKAIQLVATSDIADLSIYGVGSANNGNGGGTVEFTFPAVSLTAGSVIYVASETTGFTSYFGFAPDYTSSAASINGDDAIELFENGTVVDVFGEVSVDGSGQPWEYQDGWASRAIAEGPSTVFDVNEWTFSGPNALDGVTTNATASNPFPLQDDTGGGGGGAPVAVAINEYRISSSGSSDDTSNFVELFTTPGASLAGKTLLVISGEFEPGTIDFAIDLSAATADENGFVLIGNDQNPNLGSGDVGVPDLDFFGSPQTFLVVDGFTGSQGDDIDPNNDGVIDTAPWSEILDGVAGVDGDGTPDQTYADVVIPADGNFSAAGAARSEDGTGAFEALPFSDTAGDTPGATNVDDTGGGGGGGEPVAVAINEYRISSSGSSDDTSNFVELFTTPGASLAGKTLLVISGEFEPGTIDFAIDLSAATADENGFVLIGNDQNPNLGSGDVGVPGLDFFGSPQTFLVVDGFTGSQGDDIDPNNDGVIDTAPWSEILDGVAGVDGDGTPDQTYADVVIPADGNFSAAGAARSEDGTGAFEALPFSDTAGDTPGSTNVVDTGADRVTIMEIQGAGHVSGLVSTTPLDPTTGASGPRVLTNGIVTAVDSNGFYMQDPDGDGDIATSDAIFVFTSDAPGVAIGDSVDVEGTVSEFYPGGQGTGNLSTTQLSGSPEITVLSSGNALPASVVLGAGGRALPSENIEDDNFASFDPETDGIDFWESLEGMLVTAPQPVAVSGTSRFDELFVVVDGGEGATGLSERGTLNISPDDFNPEKVQIDWDFGLDAIDVNVGATFEDVTGVVSYDFGNFQINPTEQLVVIEPSALEAEVTELAGSENQLSIASYNVLNLDPIVEEQALTNNGEARNVDDDLGNGRFDAIAEQIVNNLGSPDIIGLQEIQDNTGGETGDGVTSASLTFETLIDAIDMADDGLMNDSSGYAYIDNTFISDLSSGGQPGGNIRTGFLYKEDRVSLVEGSVQTISSQDPGGAFEGARLPLVATFEFNGEEVTVVNNHFSSKGGSAPILGVEQDFAARQEDVNVNGSLDERQAQSEAVAGFVSDTLAEDADANVVVLGDMNEFEFVSPVTGLEDAGLTNLTNTLPEDERYSFNFQGNSQSLDHILVSDALATDAQFDIVHTNSEFAETDNRASDHDPLVALLTIGDVAPETINVAVDFEKKGWFGTKAIESVDGTAVDVDKLAFFRKAVNFNDVDVRLNSAAPGHDKLTFFGGEVGVSSRQDSFFRGEAGLVNDREKLVFRLKDGEFGDATEAYFDFAEVRGDGEVNLRFFDDGAFVGSQVVDANEGFAAAGLEGQTFDKVKVQAVGNTAFSLDGFGFDRIVEDEFMFV